MKTYAFRLLSMFLLVAMVLAGCGSKPVSTTNTPEPAPSTEASKSPEPTAKPEPKLEPVTAKIGGTDRVSLKHLPLLISSFGEKQAVSVDLKEYSSGTNATKALLSKEVDFAFLQAEHVLRDTSGELQIIALVTRYPGSAIVVQSSYKDKIKSVADLAGMKVGVSSLGAASHQFALTLLESNNIDSKAVNIQPVGLNAPEVFSQDKVPAMVTIEPYITQVVESGQGFVLVDTRNAAGTQQVYGKSDWPWIAMVTRVDVIQNNPELVQRTTSALADSLRQIASMSIEEVVSKTPAEMFPNGDKAFFQKILTANRAQFTPDGKFSEQLMQPVWANMQKLGAVPKEQALNFTAVTNTQFISK